VVELLDCLSSKKVGGKVLVHNNGKPGGCESPLAVVACRLPDLFKKESERGHKNVWQISNEKSQ